MINLNEIIKVNYKNTSFSAGIIAICAETLAQSLTGSKDYKTKSMPNHFWDNFYQIEDQYKRINKELEFTQDLSLRLSICHKYPALKPMWNELTSPTGKYSVFTKMTEFEKVWNNLILYYPELGTLTKTEGSFIIKTSYEKFAYDQNNGGYPSFADLSKCFSNYTDKSARHLEAAFLIQDIYQRVSTAA